MLPVVKVVGVGGAGGNAVVAMSQRDLHGAELLAFNTDAQALSGLGDIRTMALGERATRGLGAGGRSEVGRAAALESCGPIAREFANTDMVFVTVGMGGGTGTGAAPIVAHAARASGALVVGVVSKPFMFEGLKRRRAANEGLTLLEEQVDALLVIENDRLLNGGDLTIAEAMGLADEVLCDAVTGIGDLVGNPGIVNLDFAHVRGVLQDGGRAVMGRGSATTDEGGALAAVERAIACPLLDDDSVAGAQRILLHLAAGPELPLRAVERASMRLEEVAHPDAEIVFGVVHSEALVGHAEATVIATCIDAEAMKPAQSAQPRNALVML